MNNLCLILPNWNCNFVGKITKIILKIEAMTENWKAMTEAFKTQNAFLWFVYIIDLSAIFPQVYIRRTATSPPRSRIPDGRYPPRGIPLDAPFEGCTAIICISTVRGTARSAKGSQILLSNSGTRRRSGGASAKWANWKNKMGIRAMKTACGLPSVYGEGGQAAIAVVDVVKRCIVRWCVRAKRKSKL